MSEKEKIIHQVFLKVTDKTIEDPTEFALEKHLEDFLVKNWKNTSLGKEYDIYDEKMETFYNNDIETDNFLSNIDKISIDEAIKSLNNEIVPKWNTNLEVLNNISQIENLPSELVEENRLLLEYSSLKLQSFEIIKKVIIFDNDKYNSELKAINLKKDSIIDLINKLE